jgi:hypothetical protein
MPQPDAGLEAFSLVGCGVAAGEEFAHAVEVGVVKHAAERRFEVGFQITGQPKTA